MKMTKTVQGDTLVIALEGSLDSTTSDDLERELERSLQGINTLTLDFEKVDYISSAGLRVLLTAHKAMYGKGGVNLVHVNPDIQDLFEVTGFAELMSID